jgi:LiaI-LiaF-like transmembrane region
MDRGRRSALAGGIILILLGVLFLAGQLGLLSWAGELTWPLILVGIGAAMLIIGLLVGEPGMAVPACVVAGIGSILYWQNNTGQWETWAYVWTLIPGFVGIGTILNGLFEWKWEAIRGGLWLLLISAILFGIFSSIFAPMFGGTTIIGQWWPLLLILLGILTLLEAVTRGMRHRATP